VTPGELPLHGGCLCGGVRYEISEPPLFASYCHCTRCQRRTGCGASPSARIVAGSLRIVSGEELVKVFDPRDGFGKAFCSECGSALWSVDPESREPAGVRLGSFDSDPGVRPTFRTFTAYAAAWEPILDDLQRYPDRRPPNE